MRVTMKRALIAIALGFVVAVGSLGLGTGEAHARVYKPVMCTPETCKYSVLRDGDQAVTAEVEAHGEILVGVVSRIR